MLLDMPLGKARGCGFYRNRQILNGIKPKMRNIDAGAQAWENRGKRVGGTGEYTTARIPFRIVTERTIKND